MSGLGRRVPTDWRHVEKYPFSAAGVPDRVERVLSLPYFHPTWDQGEEGACVGFGTSMMMSVINGAEGKSHKYDPWWLWDRAKEIDEWADTNPGDSNGTSVRAACDVLRTLGHVRIVKGKPQGADILQGILENRWARSVDDIRAAIAGHKAISMGVNWYRAFDTPIPMAHGLTTEYFIGTQSELGHVRGGHDVCLYGWSDRRQAAKIKNSWGKGYPTVWVPASVLERLIREDGEFCLVTDRPNP